MDIDEVDLEQLFQMIDVAWPLEKRGPKEQRDGICFQSSHAIPGMAHVGSSLN